jgi:predicted molibdopterin-dependent oxidoreductase YjgC
MTNEIQVHVNGRPVSVRPGTIVASAIALAGIGWFRSSVQGQPRGPLCGMGICMECRATINGRPFSRTCLILCEQDMEIETGCKTSETARDRKAESSAPVL